MGYTSIVEMLPAESESHQLLAEIRQRQNRWPEAIVQWQQVARIRSLEPTGLIGLAAALVHEHQWPEAADVLARLKKTAWPVQFNNPPADLPRKIRALQEQIERRAE